MAWLRRVELSAADTLGEPCYFAVVRPAMGISADWCRSARNPLNTQEPIVRLGQGASVERA